MQQTTAIRARTILQIALTLIVATGASPAIAKRGTIAEIAGTVVDQADRPVAGARISFTPEASSESAEPVPAAATASATTNAEGRYSVRIENPEVAYRFLVESDGFAPFSDVVVPTAGERSGLDIRIVDLESARKQQAIDAFNAGVRAFGTPDSSAAEAKFSEAAALDPTLPEPHLGLAQVAYRSGELEQALAAAERYISMRPGDTTGLTLALAIASDLGNEARVAELTAALAESDDTTLSAQAIFNQAAEALEAGDQELAIGKLERAAELDPGLAPAHASLAALYFNRGSYREAVSSADRLLALDSENIQATKIRYLALDILGDEAAAAALEAYLAVDADAALDILYHRAVKEFEDNGPARAVAVLERILQLRPDHARAHYTLGLCFTSSDPEKARFHLGRYLELTPDDPDAATAREVLEFL